MIRDGEPREPEISVQKEVARLGSTSLWLIQNFVEYQAPRY
jgi:hypothetical protein